MDGHDLMDYGKLAEQYGSFLVAMAGVSITVLALVLAIWSGQPRFAGGKLNSRSPLIFSLLVATFCSLGGAHLMAETAAFVAGGAAELKAQAVPERASQEGVAKRWNIPKVGLGRRQFLLAGVNIFIGVPVVMFAMFLLATQYRRVDENTAGIRKFSLGIFGVVVVCVLNWMEISIVHRMPPPVKWYAVIPFAIGPCLLLASLLPCVWRCVKKNVSKVLVCALGISVASTLCSIIWLPRTLYVETSAQVGNPDASFFVAAVTLTCFLLSITGFAMVYNLKAKPQQEKSRPLDVQCHDW